jgi:hypothetical protein
VCPAAATTSESPAGPVLADPVPAACLRYAVGENFGYRQLGHVSRIEGLWQLARKAEWGAMERKGLSGRAALPLTSTGPAGTQSPARLGR